jgi:hypothetical protein
MNASKTTLIAAAALALSGAALAAAPTGRGMLPLDHQAEATKAAGQLKVNISYHGGPVMNDPNGANVYYIWYGDWTGNTTPTILTRMINNVTGSRWYNINTTYYGGSASAPVHVQNKINFGGATTDSYSQGTALSDDQIRQIVADKISTGALPSDPNAVYFVLTSPDVTATSGFCSAYCGWHDHATITGTDIKYSFVGNASTQCPSGCIAADIQTTSPNNNPGADGMASVLMHELVETVSDPDLNAWFDRIGQENADKCAWRFGNTKVNAAGAPYNVMFGKGKYLIQQNWDANQQRCLTGL